MTLKDPARSKREDLTADGTGTVYGTVVTDGDFGEMARSLQFITCERAQHHCLVHKNVEVICTLRLESGIVSP